MIPRENVLLSAISSPGSGHKDCDLVLVYVYLIGVSSTRGSATSATTESQEEEWGPALTASGSGGDCPPEVVMKVDAPHGWTHAPW